MLNCRFCFYSKRGLIFLQFIWALYSPSVYDVTCILISPQHIFACNVLSIFHPFYSESLSAYLQTRTTVENLVKDRKTHTRNTRLKASPQKRVVNLYMLWMNADVAPGGQRRLTLTASRARSDLLLAEIGTMELYARTRSTRNSHTRTAGDTSSVRIGQ